jgi:TPR repeat protein
LIDERGTTLHSFSFCELLNKKDIFKLARKMREGEEIKNYQATIEQYTDLPGALYWIALELSLAVYDERGSEEMDTVSQQLFRDLAEKGDARGCHELASHYYFNTEEKDEVIKWRKRAIEEGETADLKELADFIIDEYPEKIDLALDTLHTMQQNNISAGWAFWKEGKIYMKGIGGIKSDPANGFMLTKKASDLGHTSAKSDLAFYYYKGMGVTKDLHIALQLLTDANEASKEVNNSYMDWGGSETDDIDEADALAEGEVDQIEEGEPDDMEEGEINEIAEGDFEALIALIKKELNK